MRFRTHTLFLLLVALLLACCLFAAPTVHAEGASDDTAAAQEDDARSDVEDDDDGVAEESEKPQLVSARAIFPRSAEMLQPTLPAGSKAEAVISYRNNQPGHTHTVMLVAGYIKSLFVQNHVVQNFSIVRHARTVLPMETMSFQYSFIPDAQLEPNDYTLILGLYFQDNVTNNTHFATAFNGTVTVEESLAADPKAILTYMTLFAMLAGTAYFVAARAGLVAWLRSAMAGDSARRRVEVGTHGEAYDPDYIHSEHQKYKESVMRRLSPTLAPKKAK